MEREKEERKREKEKSFSVRKTLMSVGYHPCREREIERERRGIKAKVRLSSFLLRFNNLYVFCPKYKGCESNILASKGSNLSLVLLYFLSFQFKASVLWKLLELFHPLMPLTMQKRERQIWCLSGPKSMLVLIDYGQNGPPTKSVDETMIRSDGKELIIEMLKR